MIPAFTEGAFFAVFTGEELSLTFEAVRFATVLARPRGELFCSTFDSSFVTLGFFVVTTFELTRLPEVRPAFDGLFATSLVASFFVALSPLLLTLDALAEALFWSDVAVRATVFFLSAACDVFLVAIQHLSTLMA